MRKSSKLVLSAAVATTVASFVPASAWATDYTWNTPAGGPQQWQNAANWTPSGFPNANVDRADLRVNLASNLTLDVGATDVAVGALSLGGTGAAVTTDVTSSGGLLRLGADGVIVPTTAVTSQGVAGSVNRVSANTLLLNNVSFDAASTRDFTFAGNLQMDLANRTITNNAAGPVLRLGSGPTSEIRVYDATDPLLARTLTLSGVANSVTEINGTFNRGPNNVGGVSFDAGGGMAFATFIFNAPQPFSGGLQRGTYVANDNLAFGPGTLTAAGGGTLTQTGGFTTGNGNQATWSGTITSAKPGGVTLPMVLRMGNSHAFAGNENIVLSGAISQGNNRAMGNAIAAGRTLTMTPDPVTNPTGVSIAISYAVGDGNRTWIVEGTGTTIVNGKVINNLTDDSTIVGAFEKRGSGRTELNNGGNTIRGQVRARGGNLVFGAANSWGTPTNIEVQTNGGIWYTPGLGAPGWDDGANSLVAKILPTSTGFFAVPASAAGTNFDFSTGNLNLNAKSVGIGADGDVTFTGTVTPDATAGYNWGGNTGTLTLGANKSTGANRVTYKNGGTVVLTGTQSYTGSTAIEGANMVTSQAGILTKNLNSTATTNVFTPTVLSVGQLANAGAASSLGASSNDAANLVLAGGTLRQTGGAAGSTDRLFTVGLGGATLESAGAGAMQFTNAGANVTAGTGARTLTLTGTNAGANSVAGTLANGAVATDTLAVAKTGAGQWVLGGANTYTGGTNVAAGTLVAGNADGFGTGGLTIANGATARAQAGLPKALNLPSQPVMTAVGTTGGTLDQTDGALVVRHADQAAGLAGHATVNGLVRNAFNEFQWNQPGITSSTVAADVANSIPAAVGILFNNDGGGNALFYGDGTALPQFEGRSVDGNSVLTKSTLLGDGDLNGTVDSVDFALFQAGYTGAAPYIGWGFGDYDYNGVIDSVDFGLFQAGYQYNQSNPTPEMVAFAGEHHLSLVAAAVPEPATLGVLALGAVGLLARRRRTR